MVSKVLITKPFIAGAKIGVLAKIESADSVSHLEEILDAVDGAMVARGDLGAELPVEEVCPFFQSTEHALQPCHCLQPSTEILSLCRAVLVL